MTASTFSADDDGSGCANAAVMQQATTDQDLLTLTCGPEGNVVRLIPDLVVTESEIEAGLQCFEAAAGVVVGAVPATTGSLGTS